MPSWLLWAIKVIGLGHFPFPKFVYGQYNDSHGGKQVIKSIKDQIEYVIIQ